MLCSLHILYSEFLPNIFIMLSPFFTMLTIVFVMPTWLEYTIYSLSSTPDVLHLLCVLCTAAFKVTCFPLYTERMELGNEFCQVPRKVWTSVAITAKSARVVNYSVPVYLCILLCILQLKLLMESSRLEVKIHSLLGPQVFWTR